MLATLAGILLALMLALAGWTAFRLIRGAARGLAALVRLPRQRVAVLVARLRGLRLSRSRAVARAEGERASALAEEVRRLRADLRLARAERDEARGLLALVTSDARSRMWRRRPAAPDQRFLLAKREFARRFHPDRLPQGARDRTLRAAIFTEFWTTLKRIEREG